MATYAEIAKPNTEKENTQTEFIPTDTVILMSEKYWKFP